MPERLVLPVRRLAEFLLRTGSIDNRFTGFDRANEGARLHRRLQRAAQRTWPDYAAEVPLRRDYDCGGVLYTLEGRADGIFTDADGTVTVDEIKTTALPAAQLTGEQSPEHWAQGRLYAAMYAQDKALPRVRVRLTYYQIDEEQVFAFSHDYTAAELDGIVTGLLAQYAPWAKRAAAHLQARQSSLAALSFPFAQYRPGQRALAGAVYRACAEGGRLLCQAPTGIGKTMSVLYPALKALGGGGPVFYLTARGTTRAAAQEALARLHAHDPSLTLRSVTLTAKDKLCPCETRECTPDACPYANGYYARVRDALWDALDADALDADALRRYAEAHTVCPFELGLDLSLWCDVVVGDYNYLFDPAVHLARFFDGRGDYLFLVDEAHNLPDRARDMHSASLAKGAFSDAKRLLGRGKSRLKTALNQVIALFSGWRQRCDEAPERTVFQAARDEAFDRALERLRPPLEAWLDDHRERNEAHAALLQLYFDTRAWLRTADTFDDRFVLQAAAFGRDVRLTQLCLDPGAFLAADFAKGRAAVLFSATLAPAGYYKDLCGVPDARAVALRSPFPPERLGLWCANTVSTRYKDRAASVGRVAAFLAAMVGARAGNYLVFFPSYAYLEQTAAPFAALCPNAELLKQESAMDEAGRADFLARFTPQAGRTLVGFAVMGGVFGEGVDLAGERLIGVAVVGPGLPQVSPRQEQLRAHFERTRGAGFDYAYRYPGMNKVLQAAGRVIRTPEDKGVVLLIDDRFTAPDNRRLMPPHWAHLAAVQSEDALRAGLAAFWGGQTET